MAIRQLRNHIPIGGPARREPVDGTETVMAGIQADTIGMEHAEGRRSNIVMIMTDQQHRDSPGCYGAVSRCETAPPERKLGVAVPRYHRRNSAL